MRVKSDLGAGSIILAGPDGDVTLSWAAADEARERLLPAGTYRLRTTRSERSQGDEHWFVSSTGPAGKPRRFAAGAVETIKVDDSVRFEGRAKRESGELQLNFMIAAADGRGLSVYRDDRRVDVGYEVLDRKGGVLATGTMNYG